MHGKLSLMTVQQKYKKGQPVRQLHRCLGYEKDLYGNLIPDKNASLVRHIFQLAAEGNSMAEITRYLNKKKIKTQNGKVFSRSTVSRILHNNGYKGDYICQRYYVDSNRKLVRNKGEKPMYYIRQDHIPIISCDLWEKAQNALKKSRYKQVHNLEKKPVCDKAIDNLACCYQIYSPPFAGKLFHTKIVFSVNIVDPSSPDYSQERFSLVESVTRSVEKAKTSARESVFLIRGYSRCETLILLRTLERRL